MNKKSSNAFLTAHSLYSCLGDTTATMNSLYSKKCGLTLNSSYLNAGEAILGTLPIAFSEALHHCIDDVIAQSHADPKSMLLIVGSSVGGMPKSEEAYFSSNGDMATINVATHHIHSIAEYLQHHYGFQSTRSVSTACTSSSNALLLAKRLISLGAYESICVLGTDELCKTTVNGFHSLGILSSDPCKPFDVARKGINISEGIAAAVIQNRPNQHNIIIKGAAGSSDAYHITKPDPEAKGAIASMQRCLDDASLNAHDIDYINAHGTGTKANDETEAKAIASLFTHRPYVSSTKSMTGHALGATGLMEALYCAEVLLRQKVIPNCNLDTIENSELNFVQESVETKILHVLSNSFAFGGNNTSIILGLDES